MKSLEPQREIGLEKLKNSPFVTVGLIAVNVLVFLLNEMSHYRLYDSGSLSPAALIYNGEFYRVFTAMFLHGGMEHLINNMLLLGGLGVMMENEIGHIWFFLLYFGTGIGGQVLSLAYKLMTDRPEVGSIGASGAVLGLVAVLLSMTLLWKRDMESSTWKRVATMIFFTLYSGMRTPNVDNAAHLGGLLMGMALGPVMCLHARWRERSGRRRWF